MLIKRFALARMSPEHRFVTTLLLLLPAVLAGLRTVRPDARAAYVMTDGGALPAWFSRTVDGLRSAGWLAGWPAG